MQYTTIRRYSTLGVYVVFRLEGTFAELWRAPMKMLPAVDHEVGHRVNGNDVETWYKVEGYKWEFEAEQGEYGEPPQPYMPDHSYFGVACIVSPIV